jgi:hypothetical protein
MPLVERIGFLALLALAAVLAFGCGGKSGPSLPAEQIQLKEINEMYWHFVRSHSKPPAKLADLATRRYEGNFSGAVDSLKKGKYLVVWGVKDKDAGTVLAYEKDVPARGGPVLMADGTIREMTAEEFRAAKKS